RGGGGSVPSGRVEWVRPGGAPAAAQGGPQRVRPQAKKEPLVDQVRKSIDNGVKFIRSQQRANGSWELYPLLGGYEGGATSLALLALMNSGVPATDPAIQQGLKYLREINTTQTYVKALQTMAYAEAGQREDAQRITDNVEWLIKARVMQDKVFIGWSYNMALRNTADGSNPQYAVLGRLAGKQGGAIIKKDVWEGIRDHYIRTQVPDADGTGHWEYIGRGGAQPHRGSKLTMTE